MNGEPDNRLTSQEIHKPGHYVMEGTVNGKPFTREFVTIEDYNALQAHYAALLALAKQYASECSGCDGKGTWMGPDLHTEPCEDCADIRAIIDKAEGRI